MKNFTLALKNYLSQLQSMLSRKKKAKQEEEDDPFIYPHF
jgi:hypothetical protein